MVHSTPRPLVLSPGLKNRRRLKSHLHLNDPPQNCEANLGENLPQIRSSNVRPEKGELSTLAHCRRQRRRPRPHEEKLPSQEGMICDVPHRSPRHESTKNEFESMKLTSGQTAVTMAWDAATGPVKRHRASRLAWISWDLHRVTVLSPQFAGASYCRPDLPFFATP
jgi:hypothetical protein